MIVSVFNQLVAWTAGQTEVAESRCNGEAML